MPVYSEASGRSNASGSGQVDNSKTISDLQQFVTEFREHDAFIYRDRLRANCLRKEWTLEVEMGHLIGWREDLASRCRNEPGEMLPLVSRDCFEQVHLCSFAHTRQPHLQFEIALRNVARNLLFPTAASEKERAERQQAVPEIQLQLRSGSRLMQFRELGVSLAPSSSFNPRPNILRDALSCTQATNISRLVRLPGIVISASTLSSRAIRLSLQCKSCRHVMSMEVQGGFSGFQLPRKCVSYVLSLFFLHSFYFVRPRVARLTARDCRQTAPRPQEKSKTARSTRTRLCTTSVPLSTSRRSSCKKRPTWSPSENCLVT